MMKKRGRMLPSVGIAEVLLLVCIAFLASMLPVFADTDLGDLCTSEEDCSIYAELGYDFAVYCHPERGTCHTVDENGLEATDSAAGTSTPPPSLNQRNTNVTSRNAAPGTSGTNGTSGSSPSSTEVRQLQSSVQTLSSGLAVTQGRVAAVEQSVGSVQASIQEANNKLNQLSTSFREFQSQQEDSQETVKSDIQAVATGLAGLQDNVVETQEDVALLEDKVKESASTTGMLVTILVTAALLAAGGSAYWWYRRSTGGKKDVHPTILQFITDHIRAGKKFSHIKEGLAQAGWSHDDAAWAYKEALKKNYQHYRASQPSEHEQQRSVRSSPYSSPHSSAVRGSKSNGNSNEKNKMLMISAVSILLVIGIFFAIKGATGQAIHFTAEVELETFVQDLLERLADENVFYPLLPAASLCVEVFDQGLFGAYHLQVTDGAHKVIKVERCSGSGSAQYDIAIRFTDWQTFGTVMRKMSCEVIANQHGKGFWVLPSKYVLPGFKKNPFEDYSAFCPVLLKCFDQQKLQELKIMC